ncbi:MAG TPA: small ribosomal subunit Rsm22 family protein [Candidatus Angelobacter sp.]|nr:small ribosomal subunit Rsm22 family protein [Candidatus Angelobacter sp.]
MRLPPYLTAALQELISHAGSSPLAAVSRQLTHRYKNAEFTAPALRSPADRSAYLAVRLPATFAANLHVFSELRRRAAKVEIASLLDLGAGPGTSLFASGETFSCLRHATLLEADPQWIQFGKKLAEQSPLPAVREANWLMDDLRNPSAVHTHDAVVISYALGELAAGDLNKVVRRAWLSTAKFLILIEPGTKRGFAAINTARSLLIAQQAQILAPCPHHNACPMAAANDWCHFSQRLERSSEHRRIKGGSRGYEDEKFSYLIATRLELTPTQARIVRHPSIHSGHVQLELCTENGSIERRTVARSDKGAYNFARQAEWGEEWNE